MLALFRTNQLVLSVLLIFYVAGLHIAGFVFPETTANSNPGILSEWLMTWAGEGSLLSKVFVILLLFLQGILLNIIVASNRLTTEVSLYPGLFYILIASSLPDFQHLSPLHLANTFYIIVIMELMSTYKKSSAADRIFNAGFWAAVASFFYFSYIIFLFLVFIALNVLRAFNIKERLMFIIGAIVPYILLGVYFLWNDQFDFFIQAQFFDNINVLDFKGILSRFSYVKLAIFALLLLIILFSYGSYTFKRNIQVQKKISILYWGMFIALFSIFFQAGIRLDHLLILTVPIGVLLSINFSLMKKNTAELLHLLLLVFVILLQLQPHLLPL